MNVKVEVDREVNAAYVTLSGEEVVRTVQVNPSVLVDLDRMGMVVGIEVLSIDAELPLAQLSTDFHVHSEVVGLLHKLRPSIGFQYARFQQSAEGVSAREGQPVSA
jgi:uncharacterized protein YuzE